MTVTERDFCYWLHGWSEINGGKAPTPEQWQTINDHLDLVFNKVTPDRKIEIKDSATYCHSVESPMGTLNVVKPTAESHGGYHHIITGVLPTRADPSVTGYVDFTRTC